MVTTISKSIRVRWTFADLVPHLRRSSDICDPFVRELMRKRRCPKTSINAKRVAYHEKVGRQCDHAPEWKDHPWNNDHARYSDMRPSENVAGSPLRRQVFHWRAQHQDLLPIDLPCAYGEREKRSLLSDGCSSGGIWISSLPAMPPGVFTGNSGLVWYFEHGFEGVAPDWRIRPGRRWNGGPCRPGRGWVAPSATAIYPALGCAAARGGTDSTAALLQEPYR